VSGPDTEPELVDEAVRLAEHAQAVVVGAAPVTDTVKSLDAGFVGATLDRDALVSVRLPVAVPAALATRLDPPVDDLAAWVTRVRRNHPVRFLSVRE
jgi:hypothetical protein